MSNEHTLWQIISNNIGNKGHFNRIESHATRPGFPDVEYCLYGVQGTLELKHTSSKVAPEIRPVQMRWAKKRVLNGGIHYIVTMVDDNSMNERYGKFFMIHTTHAMMDNVKKKKVDNWKKNAIMVWTPYINWREFTDIITT